MTDGSSGEFPVEATVPQSARVWNYWSGGKDNYAVDREVGDQIREMNPHIVEIARAQRQFLVRAVTYLTREAGIRQFLDIGTGLPTANNTHEVAQSIAPEARIVYVDHDPLVLAHARALLVGSPEGTTAYIDADLRGPDKILRNAADTWTSPSLSGSCCWGSSATSPTTTRRTHSCDAWSMRCLRVAISSCATTPTSSTPRRWTR